MRERAIVARYKALTALLAAVVLVMSVAIVGALNLVVKRRDARRREECVEMFRRGELN